MYSPEQRKDIQDRICSLLMVGKSLRSIIETVEGMPSYQNVCNWLRDDAAFFEQYAHAREAQADYYADEIATIADTEPDANKARVRIDARKWAASKLKPKVYGDKLDITGDLSLKLPDEQVESRLAHLLRKAGTLVAVGGAGEAESAPEILRHVPRDGASET